MVKYLAKKKAQREVICLGLLFLAILLFVFGLKLRLFFNASVILVFILLIPKYVVNPKTVIFFYYCLWYVIAPLFANRYKNLYENKNTDKALLMILSVYIVSMVVVDCFVDEKIGHIRIMDDQNNYRILQLLFLMMGILGLLIFIQRTGGLALWLNDPYTAFFNRRGSGAYYLLFEYGFLCFLFLEGASGKRITQPKMIVGLLICVGVTYFIGSKATAFIMVLMLYHYLGNRVKVISPQSVALCCVGLAIFVYGMIVRVGEYMVGIAGSISTMLNYFDTLDELLILLRDFKPSLFMTCFMPLNWIGSRIGIVGSNAVYDMSVWLTQLYYPESWINGGTHQWPIEADMYLNYYFVFGFPLVCMYFWIISKLYRYAQIKGGVWFFIYINEWFGMIGHLRGGIFLHIYWYLIPLYMILLIIDKHFLHKDIVQGDLKESARVKMGVHFVGRL